MRAVHRRCSLMCSQMWCSWLQHSIWQCFPFCSWYGSSGYWALRLLLSELLCGNVPVILPYFTPSSSNTCCPLALFPISDTLYAPLFLFWPTWVQWFLCAVSGRHIYVITCYKCQDTVFEKLTLPCFLLIRKEWGVMEENVKWLLKSHSQTSCPFMPVQPEYQAACFSIFPCI